MANAVTGSNARGAKLSVLAALLTTASMLGACAQIGGGTDNRAAALLAANPVHPDTQSEDGLGQAISYWGKAYRKNPRDKKAALSYARNLKAAGQNVQALAILRYASAVHGNDREIAAEYGRLALAAGQVELARKLLAMADDPANPDWRIVMGRGTVLANLGQYKAAVPFFERALHLAPSNPTALSNLAMAHAGSGELNKAEKLLRRALVMPNAKPQIRDNLVAVLKLMGRADESQRVAQATGPDQIRQTVGAPEKANKFNRRGTAVARAE